MTLPPSCLLLVRPPSSPREDLEALLEPLGAPLVHATSAREAVPLWAAHDCALLLVDARGGDFDAGAWRAALGSSERNAQTPLLLLTGAEAAPAADAWRHLAPRAVDCLPAPLSPELLRTRVRFLLDLDRRERALRPREEAARRLRESEALQRDTEAAAHRAAAEADAERRLLDAILEAAPAGIIVADVRGRLLRMNPANSRLWGSAPYSREVDEYREWKGWWADGTARHGQRLGPHEWAMARALHGETVTEDIVSIEPFDAPDTRRTLLNCAAPVRDASGSIMGGVVVQTDITALKASEARFRTLTETIPQMVWTALPDGTIDDCNSRWRDYTGLSLEETRARGRGPVLHPDDVASALALWAHSVATGEPYQTEYRLRRARDGVYRWHLGRALPLHDETGHVVKWFGTCTDIDEYKRTQARLEQAQQEIRELNQGLERRVEERTARMQDAMNELESFSYSVSHDLRAPLRHILGFAQLLDKRAGAGLDAKSRDYMRVISDAAQRGGQLVDDLLAFSRMGRKELQKAPVDLGRLVDEVRRELAPEAEGRRVTWKVAPLPGVEADPSLLHAALKNLLSNALKYTRPRSEAIIEVLAHQRGGELELVLRDNGVGFEMEYVDKLFGVFQRLHSTEQFEGTGIGLANVRRIVQRHGGRVWAEGRPDHGATFHLTLPHAPLPGAP